MSNLSDIKKIIDWMFSKDPEIGDAYIQADHEVIYLPIPDGVSQEELKEKAVEFNFSIEADSIMMYV